MAQTVFTAATKEGREVVILSWAAAAVRNPKQTFLGPNIWEFRPLTAEKS